MGFYLFMTQQELNQKHKEFSKWFKGWQKRMNMNTIVTHEELSIEVEYDADEGQKGDYFNPPIPPSLEVCGFEIEETLDNMDMLMGLVNAAIEDDFEFCCVFICDKTGYNVIVIDYYDIVLEIVFEDSNEIHSSEILDTPDNWKIVHELLEADLTDTIL